MRPEHLRQRSWLAGLALAAGVAALLVESCSTTDRAVVVPLQIEGATFVGDKACADCHQNITRSFRRVRTRVCAWTRRPGRINRDANRATVPAANTSRSEAVAGWSDSLSTRARNPRRACNVTWNCRRSLIFHNTIRCLEGKMNCVQCHDPHGTDILKPAGGLAMARLNEACSQCHRAETKPVFYPASGDAPRMHGLPQPARLHERERCSRSRIESLPALPCPGGKHLVKYSIGGRNHTRAWLWAVAGPPGAMPRSTGPTFNPFSFIETRSK